MAGTWFKEHFELYHGDATGNVLPTEGLRGFAIFLVFLVHYVSLIDPWITSGTTVSFLARSLQTIGNSGVDLFFVLSGYLIYGSLISRDQKLLPFIKRRLQRIYPVFTTVFIIYVVMSWALPSHSKIPADGLAASIYLVQNFLLLPGLLPIQPIITVAWSLSYEMFYYLLIPVLIGLLGLRARQVSMRVGFFIVVAILFTGVSALYGGPIRLIMFISGILLHEVIRHRLFPAVGSGWAMLALVVGLGAALAPIFGSHGIAFKTGCLFIAFFIVCQTCFTRPFSVLGRAFSFDAIRWLGNMSYSYYLIHDLALKAAVLLLGKLLPPGGHSFLFFGAMMVVMFMWTLIPSAIVFIAVERRFSLHLAKKPMGRPEHGSARADEASRAIPAESEGAIQPPG